MNDDYDMDNNINNDIGVDNGDGVNVDYDMVDDDMDKHNMLPQGCL